LGAVLFVGAALLGAAFWYFSTHGDTELASKNSKRPLLLSDATAKTDKIDDEVLVALNDPALAQAWV